MRIMLLAALFFLTSTAIVAQENSSRIDRLTTEKDVEEFIRSFDKNMTEFKLQPIGAYTNLYDTSHICKRIADSLGITKSFYKADFDRNGYTDLMAIGQYYSFIIFIVFSYGGDSLELQSLTRRSFQNCTFPKMINDSVMRYYYFNEPGWRDTILDRTLESKDLIFKFGDLVEYNTHPSQYAIEKIEYETTACFGTCPIFRLTINKDGSAIFYADSYNRQTRDSKIVSGRFKTNLRQESYAEIAGLLNYIDFPALKDNYEVNWTDDQTSILTITYNNGKVKKIQDYGLIGTYGLDRLYELLFNLRFNQAWK